MLRAEWPYTWCKQLAHRVRSCAVEGVTVYISDFKRSLADKLSKNFFSEPSQVNIRPALQPLPNRVSNMCWCTLLTNLVSLPPKL